MSSSILQLLSIAALAGLKFIVASGILLAQKLGFLEVFFTLLIGGCSGTIVFYYFGGQLTLLWNKFKKKKSTPDKVFTKQKRKFITLKRKYGLVGLALISPPIISIPIGNILVAHFYAKNKVPAIWMMLLGVLIWSTVIATISLFVKVNLF